MISMENKGDKCLWEIRIEQDAQNTQSRPNCSKQHTICLNKLILKPERTRAYLRHQ